MGTIDFVGDEAPTSQMPPDQTMKNAGTGTAKAYDSPVDEPGYSVNLGVSNAEGSVPKGNVFKPVGGDE